MQRTYAEARLAGATQLKAAQKAGYSAATVPAIVESKCVKAGLLPDPDVENDRIRQTAKTVAMKRQEAREVLINTLHGSAEQLAQSLLVAALKLDPSAIKEALNRLVGPVCLEVSGPEGKPLGEGIDDETISEIERAVSLVN